ncbi:hypothetical protein A0256_23715 [Mucilaginibacter sp. PAMC 26640]|nr:hypothetical protein A0256_23715 [Mucilaginibacter sp. PAMC 26640]
MTTRIAPRTILKVIFMLFIIFGMVKCLQSVTSKQAVLSNRMLMNNLYFRGTVLSVKTSNSHNFGILLLQLDTANKSRFVDTLKEGIYPYKIQNGLAEIYTNVADGIEKGDQIIIDFNEQKAYYYLKAETKHYEERISLINYSGDIQFVRNNTVFR